MQIGQVTAAQTLKGKGVHESGDDSWEILKKPNISSIISAFMPKCNRQMVPNTWLSFNSNLSLFHSRNLCTDDEYIYCWLKHIFKEALRKKMQKSMRHPTFLCPSLFHTVTSAVIFTALFTQFVTAEKHSIDFSRKPRRTLRAQLVLCWRSSSLTGFHRPIISLEKSVTIPGRSHCG